MTEINARGLTPAISLDGVLACTTCGGVWIHRGAVTVSDRVEIAFWCETCPEGQAERILIVDQDQEQTFMYWEA